MVPRRFCGIGLGLVLAACMNDYDRFSVGGSAASAGQGGTGAQGGSSGKGGASGTSGAAGAAGTAGSGGSAGASGASGAAGDTGTGGLAGSSAGGGSGSGGSGGGCSGDDLSCGGMCLPEADQRCGSCDNDCTAQGSGDGFSCSAALCGCTDSASCRTASGGSVLCLTVGGVGTCVCDGDPCVAGEACRWINRDQRCSCNGEDACAAGQTCCQTPSGCRDLRTDEASCGACGRACRAGEECVAGECR